MKAKMSLSWRRGRSGYTGEVYGLWTIEMFKSKDGKWGLSIHDLHNGKANMCKGRYDSPTQAKKIAEFMFNKYIAGLDKDDSDYAFQAKAAHMRFVRNA